MKKKNIPTNYLLLTISALMFFISSCIREPKMPTVTTVAISAVKATRAKSGGKISSDGESAILSSGMCWSTTPEPTIADFSNTGDMPIGDFEADIKWLTPNTTYYARAYVTTSMGTGYGEIFSFTTNTTLAVGDSTQGGIIAYFLRPIDIGYDPNVPHGIIAASSDLSENCSWWNGTYTSTGAVDVDYGTGNANTNAIVTNQGAGVYAAQLCNDLVLNGYNDWYLPSKIELQLLYVNRDDVGGFYYYGIYWASSESDNDEAWVHDFYYNTKYLETKNGAHYVRAVRTF